MEKLTEAQIKRLSENEKEWRVYLLRKVDSLDNRLTSFERKTYVVALMIGAVAGSGVEFLKRLF